MTLPLSRPRTYSSATKLRSADLNDLFDAIIEGWHGPKTKFVPASKGNPPNGSVSRLHQNGLDVELLTDAGSLDDESWVIPLDMDKGDRITAIRVLMSKHSASGTITARWTSYVWNVTATSHGTATNNANAPGDITLTITATVEVGDHEMHSIRIEGGGVTGDFLAGVEVDYDRGVS